MREEELERWRRAAAALEARERADWEIEREALGEARRAEREKLEAERAEQERGVDEFLSKQGFGEE